MYNQDTMKSLKAYVSRENNYFIYKSKILISIKKNSLLLLNDYHLSPPPPPTILSDQL